MFSFYTSNKTPKLNLVSTYIVYIVYTYSYYRNKLL